MAKSGVALKDVDRGKAAKEFRTSSQARLRPRGSAGSGTHARAGGRERARRARRTGRARAQGLWAGGPNRLVQNSGLHKTPEDPSYIALVWSKKSSVGSPRRWAEPRGPAPGQKAPFLPKYWRVFKKNTSKSVGFTRPETSKSAVFTKTATSKSTFFRSEIPITAGPSQSMGPSPGPWAHGPGARAHGPRGPKLCRMSGEH